jgi:hypothetical protein
VVSPDPPPAAFKRGQPVEVIANARNKTCRKGTVRAVIWHHKKGRWMYWLEENGKKVSKRYEAYTSHRAPLAQLLRQNSSRVVTKSAEHGGCVTVLGL